MSISTRYLKSPFHRRSGLFFLLMAMLSSCISTRHYQGDKPFIVANKFEVITKGGNFSKDEILNLKSRMSLQLDDSAKVNRVDKFFFFHVYDHPPVFDTAYVGKSARNIQGSMLHLGYYKSAVDYKVDTVHLPKHKTGINVTYELTPGKPTIIDTFSYNISDSSLQQIALSNHDNTIIEQGKPVTKAAVLGEISRLVDLYRNNGYYKFTSEELRMQGDTSLSILTNISDDPFEQIQQLAEAQQKRDSPKIKLALVLNPTDTNRLKQYYINNIYILPDYHPGDSLNDPTLTDRITRKDKHIIIRFHNKFFRTGFLLRKLTLKSGELYSQQHYYETLNSFSRTGVWQSVNIDIREVKDSTSNKIDLIIQLLRSPQFAFETAIETSYSANSNTNSVTAANAGNLLGLSGNVSITNRNWLKEGIRMTTGLRAGVELNIRPDSSNTKNIINSNDVTLSNSIFFPRAFPFKKFDSCKHILQTETFVNTNLSYTNRINLFNLQSITFNSGWNFLLKNKAQLVVKLLNFEFTRLYNSTDSFKKTLDENPFLRYSFNTALVAGASIGYSLTKTNPKHPGRQSSLKINAEESGFPYWQINVLHKYLRRYGKFDVEYTHSRSKPKSAFVFRAFAGVGIASKSDTTLPFFKQYFGGGSNSMRGWPIRGIGRGSQPLAPFGTNQFNDRTGDIRFELNGEYRFNIARIIPNTLQLRGAFFADAGNIWNLRNSKPGGGTDSAQFQFGNMYRDLGINIGPGLRFDFNYFIVRFDFGFRLKRPELAYVNDGWKVPALGFDDVLKKVFARGPNDEYRRWRYENFNFTIGINYPFSF
ncbi:MAG: BamA/TamA family outer membrane protein [Bacteroidetes bacterium]|nr:BamA/TamA family outer membrane protein [Bacteroidota bacterium]